MVQCSKSKQSFSKSILDNVQTHSFLKIELIVLQNLTKLNFSLLQLTNMITITYDTEKMAKIVVSSAGPQIKSKSNFLPYQKKDLFIFGSLY